MYLHVLAYRLIRLASSRAAAYLALVLAAFLWGSLGVLAKLLFRAEVSTLGLVTARHTFGAAVLGLWLAWRAPRDLLVAPRDLLYLAPLGALGMGVMNLFYFEALARTNVATAFLLQYLSPFLVVAGSAWLLKQRIAPRTYGALVLCVSGLYLVATDADPRALVVNWPGISAGLASCVLFAFFTVLAKRMLAVYAPATVLVYVFGFAAAACWLALPPWRLFALGWDARTWVGIALLVVVATVVPFGLYFWGMRQLEPTRAVLTLSVETVFAAGLAWVVIGEALAPWQVVGGALVMGAVVWLNMPQAAKPSRAAERHTPLLPHGAAGGSRRREMPEGRHPA